MPNEHKHCCCAAFAQIVPRATEKTVPLAQQVLCMLPIDPAWLIVATAFIGGGATYYLVPEWFHKDADDDSTQD